jgi:Holliday junction resolvase RusA-like endonuclease
MILKFEVIGKPQGKARARTGKGFAFTPEKTVLYENLIKTEYQRQCGLHKFDTVPDSKLKQPLEMHITAIFEIPKSYTKGKRLAAEHNIIRPTKKPDADNIAKVICDALNGIAYTDDTQIVDLQVVKLYGKVPKVTVCISDIDTSQNKPI